MVAETYVRGLTPNEALVTLLPGETVVFEVRTVAVAAATFLGPSVLRSANRLVAEAGSGR